MLRRGAFAGFLVLVLIMSSVQASAGPKEDLFSGAMKCDLSKVQAAVAAGADPKVLHPSGQNVLSLAFFCPDVTAFLIGKGVSPNEGNYPALISAANNYSVETMKLLLEAGASPSKASSTGVLPLFQVVQQTNCVPCLQMLLEKGADPKMKNAQGATPLHVLMNFSMSRENRKDAFAKSAVIMQNNYGLKVPDWLKDLPNDRNGTELDMLNVLIAKGADVNEPTPDGYTPLVMALRGGKPDVALAILKAGADPKKRAEVMLGGQKVVYNPMNLAAESGTLEIVKLMLEKGADLNFGATSSAVKGYDGTWGGDGYTPLIIAVQKGNNDIARFLVESGADLKIGANGFTLLSNAKLGMKCLASVSSKTPIYFALEGADLDLVKMIADRMTWKFNPEYSIQQWGGGGGTGKAVTNTVCAFNLKKVSPSSWAEQMKWLEAAAYLSSKGL